MDAFCYDHSKNQSKVVLKGEWPFVRDTFVYMEIARGWWVGMWLIWLCLVWCAADADFASFFGKGFFF